ncbi:hypothetical protein HW555_013805 [Spodoptera exigua]|uniref:Uncharacterized protein n=1 Tax=Spodoptera exigua TaxID=7107 RepID=A0A835KXT4_SPOEX|nr:hypothetical protein HW555_013805 [Spodoptera exigua]
MVRKRKFSAFGGKRRYKPPKIKKSKFSKSPRKSISKVTPFQTRVHTSFHVNLPSLNGDKFTNALKAIKTMKPTRSGISVKLNNVIMNIRSLTKFRRHYKLKRVSDEFVFMPINIQGK